MTPPTASPRGRGALGACPNGLEFIRLQGDTDRVLVYFPGLIDATFEPKDLIKRRERLFGPWLSGCTLYVISRRRPLPDCWSIPAMAQDYAEAVPWIAAQEGQAGAPLDIAGASFGGCIAMQFALDHPALVRRLVLQQVAARGCPEKQALARRWIRDLEQGRYLPVARSVVQHNYHGRPRLVTDLIALGSFPLVRRDFRRRCNDLARSLRALDGYDAMDRLRGMRIPTLLLAGNRDQMVPEGLIRETAAAIPNCQLKMFENGSHNVQAEQPHAYAKALLDFLEGSGLPQHRP
jgi:pimeloyl-ACP methyl ester carboxylesterase